jgi:hypothetical protein
MLLRAHWRVQIFSTSSFCSKLAEKACLPSHALSLMRKSFWGDEQKFSQPLIRFLQGDVRDQIASQKNDHGALYRRCRALQRRELVRSGVRSDTIRAGISNRAHNVVDRREGGFGRGFRKRTIPCDFAGAVPGFRIGTVAHVPVVLTLANGVLFNQDPQGPTGQRPVARSTAFNG